MTARRLPRVLYPAAVFFLLLMSPLAAQQEGGEEETPSYDLDPVTVIADRPYVDPADLPAQVSVIGPEEIAASGARSVAEIVASSVGIGAERYGNITQPGLISIRGSSAEQVLVLLDGVRLNTAQGGGVDLNALSLDSIERIEVIRGGGGALYGEGAFSGIINIVTKDGDRGTQESFLRYGYGSFNTHTFGAGSAGGFGSSSPWSYNVTAGGYYTGGAYTYSDQWETGGTAERINADGYSIEGSGKLTWKEGSGGSGATLSTGASMKDVGVPGLLEFPTENARMKDTSLFTTLAAYHPAAAVGRLDGDVSFSLQSRHYTDPDQFFGAVDDTHLNTAVSGRVSLSREFILDWAVLDGKAGASGRWDRLDSTALATESGSSEAGIMSRYGVSAFLNTGVILFPLSDDTGRLTLSPALRYDLAATSRQGEDADTAGDFSWGAGAVVLLDEAGQFRLKANGGSAYRMPTFSDLFWPATSFARGNPDLEPETSLFWDAGAEATLFDVLEVRAAWFSRRVENLIRWSPGPTGQWTPSNLGLADISGLETEVALLLPLAEGRLFWELKANYAYLHATDMTEDTATYGKQLIRRPFEKANVTTLLSHSDGHTASVTGRYVGFRYTTAMNTKTIPAYFVLDASVTAVLGSWELGISGLNLLNTPYISLEEFPVPGIELQVEARIRL